MGSEGNQQKRSEGKSGGGQTFLVTMGLLGFLMLAAALVLFGKQWQYLDLPFPELERLIAENEWDPEKNLFKEGRTGSIIYKVPKGKALKIDNLQQVEIGPGYVTGIVNARPIDQAVTTANENFERRFRTTMPEGQNQAADNLTASIQKTNPVHWKFAGKESPLVAYIPFFAAIAVFVLLFLYMMRRLGGAGSPMQFGRSRGKLHAQEDLGVSFNDVAGIDEAVEEVREVVDFLRAPEKYQRLGGRIPKGVLLVGPPGTGKTLLARAIAGEAGVPFFSLSGSDFVEMFVGVGAARVRDMFQQAESKSPCIVFIDELDALGKSRGNGLMGGHDEREQTLNALLVEMDGFSSNNGVLVMAATNRPETLDPRYYDPAVSIGHVLVDRPDVGGREEILKVHVKNVKLDPNVDLKEVAGITSGFVGADLANLVNEAALLAARNNKNSVGMIEFNEGVERVTAGLEKKRRALNEDEKHRVAYHEAGHALVAYTLPNTDPVHKVSIIPRGIAALGYTLQRPEGDRYLMTQAELESRIQVLLAGTITEEIVYKDISTGASNDLERATAIARSMVTEYGMSRLGRVNYKDSNRSIFLATEDDGSGSRKHSDQIAYEIDMEVRRIIDEGLDRVRKIIKDRRPALEALTARLIEVESVDATVLKRIMDEHSPGPMMVPGTEQAPGRNFEPPESNDRFGGNVANQ